MPSMSVSERFGIGHDVGRRLGQVVDRPGGVAIGPDAERVGPLELQQVGDLLENGGDFVVGHGRDQGLGIRDQGLGIEVAASCHALLL